MSNIKYHQYEPDSSRPHNECAVCGAWKHAEQHGEKPLNLRQVEALERIAIALDFVAQWTQQNWNLNDHD